MRKKVIFSVAVCAIALTAAVGFSLKSQKGADLNDLAVSNMEALAVASDCPNGCLEPPGTCSCYGTHAYLEARWSDDDILLPPGDGEPAPPAGK